MRSKRATARSTDTTLLDYDDVVSPTVYLLIKIVNYNAANQAKYFRLKLLTKFFIDQTHFSKTGRDIMLGFYVKHVPFSSG